MKTVIIGGTFNPVHNGHLYTSEELRLQMGFEQVIFVPSNIPAHKPSGPVAAPEFRLEMLKLALEDSSAIIDSCEIERGGVSYMIDTVKDIYRRYKVTGKISLFLGDDLIKTLDQWRNINDLLRVVDIVIAHRLSFDEESSTVPHSYLDNLPLPISSSDIRDRIKSGKAFRYLLPENVYGFIKAKGLYL